MYDKILEKVMNARYTEEFRKCREKYVSWKSSANIIDLNTRTNLKSMAGSTKKDKESKTGFKEEGTSTAQDGPAKKKQKLD